MYPGILNIFTNALLNRKRINKFPFYGEKVCQFDMNPESILSNFRGSCHFLQEDFIYYFSTGR